MSFLLLLLLAVGLVFLSRYLRSRNAQRRNGHATKKPAERQSPVAKEYPILYEFVALSATLSIVSSIFSFGKSKALFVSQYGKYQAQMQTQHLQPLPKQYYMVMLISALVVAVAANVAVWVYILLSKKKRNVINLLWILIAFGALGLAVALLKPAFSLVVGALQLGLNALVIRNLIKGKKTSLAGSIRSKLQQHPQA